MMNVTIWHLLLLLVNMALIACCVIGNSKHYSTKRENTEDRFCVYLPNFIGTLFMVLVAILSLRVLVGLFGVDRNGNRDPIGFCIGMAAFGFLCLLYYIKVLRWYVVVTKTDITIHYMLRPSRSFPIREIISVKRKVVGNEYTSEQLTIRSSSGIRLSVDTAMISYEHFYEMILQNVPESRRSGW